MRRWLLLAIALLVVLASIVFSAINAGDVALDLYFFSWNVPLGVLVLAALLLGCVLGGAVLYGAVIVPLRLRLARARREAEKAEKSGSTSTVPLPSK